MNQLQRIQTAKDTLAILTKGQYLFQGDTLQHLADAIQQCVQHTRLYLPDELDRMAVSVTQTAGTTDTVTELANETTLHGARRLTASAIGPVAVLNFASARNPGGGFLGGAQAQEESLARSSALYSSLTSDPAQAYYAHHREQRSLLYSDRAIVSPNCPVFKDDEGNLLPEPYLATVITSAAPNAGAIQRNQPAASGQIPAVFAHRIHVTLALALATGCQHIVLGAWGCGVFANDPVLVAQLFQAALGPGGAFANRFQHVLFSVFDNSRGQAVWRAFEQSFGSLHA